jgi:Ca2+-transporting ATPase
MAWHGGPPEHAAWVAFNVLVFGQLVRAYANRSLTHPVVGRARNRVLVIAIAIAAVVQLAIPSVPPLADAFRATPLDVVDLAIVAVLALAPAVLAEVLRARRRIVWVA